MRHQNGNKKLGKPTDQRIALLRSLVKSFIEYKSIETTDARAKEAKKMIEKLITLGKKGTLFARRRALMILPYQNIINDIFNNIAIKVKDRNGGYCRIIKLKHRKGDGAIISKLIFVE